jgi:hypothetical protein
VQASTDPDFSSSTDRRSNMALNDFRAIYLPYCIERKADGSWLVLNRQYKPVGFNTTEHIRYEDYPVATHFKGLGPATLAKLSYSGEAQGDRVYLYDDGSDLPPVGIPILGSKARGFGDYLISG